MASADETIRLGFQVDTADVARAAKATGDLKRATDTYAVAATQAVSAARMYNDMVNGYSVVATKAVSAAQLHARAMGAAKVAADQMADANVKAAVSMAMAGDRGSSAMIAGARGIGQAFGGATQNLQKFAYLADDLQYLPEMGLRPILNNLMMIHPAAGLVALGGDLIYRHWDKITGLFGEGHTETEAERMERLAKATNRTAEETRELNRHKQLQSDIERVAGTQSRAQQGSAAGINTAVGIVGGEKAIADLARALMELGHTAQASQGYARELMGQAAGGNIRAAEVVRSTLAGTRSGQASATGQALETGDAEANRKAVQAMDDEAKARADSARQSQVDEAAGRLGSMQGGTYGLRGSGNLFADLATVKRDLIDSGETKDAAEIIAQDVWAKVRDSMEKKVRDYAASKGLSLEAARGELLANAELASVAPAAKAKFMGPGRDVFAGAQVAANVAAEQGRQSRLMGLQARIADASGLQDPATQFLLDARTRRFGDANFARRFQRMGFEQQQATIGGMNDQADAQAEEFIRKDLIRRRINPANAAATAKAMVAEARKQANAETGDLSTEAADKNTEATARLTSVMERIERNGLGARVF